MSDEETLSVRSYSRVFHLDRRIYRVWNWPIPWRGGIPLRGFAYFLAILTAVFVLAGLPVTGLVLGVLSVKLRLVLVGALTYGSMQRTPDGRPGHLVAVSWLRLAVARWQRARSLGRTEWAARLPTRWDEHAPGLQHARIVGPAKIEFREPVRLGGRGDTVRARPGNEAGAVVVLCPDGKLEVRP